ncbi:MAG: methyltransferase domain-containing protein [Pseudomonadota bacterium]
MSGFKQVVGRKVLDLDRTGLAERIAGSARVVIDVGTGEGRFVLDAARAAPDTLCIGIDAAAENMAKASRQASAKKSRLENALFLRGAAENLPDALAGTAHEICVHYPWGSLMRIVAQPNVDHLARLAACGRSGATLSVLLNNSVFEDRDYLERLGMADIADPASSEGLVPAYRDAGFAVTERSLMAGDPDVRTAWGRHLVRGSARRTLKIEAALI